MAKTNKQNPLKYFNDQADARAKKVVEGNNKLVKAQFDTQSEEPKNARDIISRKVYNSLNKKLEDDIRDKYIKNITGQNTTEKKQFNKEYPDPIFIDPNTGGMIKNKKGGQVKSKKK
jgi:hypothetical protein